MVTVKGTASAARALSRVELRVGPLIVDAQTIPARSTADFTFNWDATRTPPGRTTVLVVACGRGAEDEVSLGSAAVVVDVAESRASRPGSAGPRAGPLWVGAVVGLSAVAGLAFSGALSGGGRPRRTPVA